MRTALGILGLLLFTTGATCAFMLPVSWKIWATGMVVGPSGMLLSMWAFRFGKLEATRHESPAVAMVERKST